MLICGDNLIEMGKLDSDSVDLIYADPPFNTGKDFGAYNDNRGFEEYLDFIKVRLVQMHRLLKPTGSLYLHLDSRFCHYIKVMLDGIFGIRNFINEIIWCYGLGGSSPKAFSRKHDCILFYSKSSDYYFNKPQTPATSNRMRGQLKGLTDIWADIPSLNNKAKERIGYPTQKPIKLLTRIISTSSNPGNLVLDPFCGSGTTCAAAKQLNRRFVGIDINNDAIEIAKTRL